MNIQPLEGVSNMIVYRVYRQKQSIGYFFFRLSTIPSFQDSLLGFRDVALKFRVTYNIFKFAFSPERTKNMFKMEGRGIDVYDVVYVAKVATTKSRDNPISEKWKISLALGIFRGQSDICFG